MMSNGKIVGVRLGVRILVVAAVTGVTLRSTEAPAQMQEATFESLAIPGSDSFPDTLYQNVAYENIPDQGAALYREYHDYGTPEADNLGSDKPENVQYVTLYPPHAGASVTIKPLWIDPIPAGEYLTNSGLTDWHDSCGHSHFGYAVMVEVTLWNGASWGTTYVPFASEGMVGRRYGYVGNSYVPVNSESNPNAPCYVTSDPDQPGGYLGSFIWKKNTALLAPFNFVFRQGSSSTMYYSAAIVAMQAATHGWGGCGFFQCFMGVGLLAYVN